MDLKIKNEYPTISDDLKIKNLDTAYERLLILLMEYFEERQISEEVQDKIIEATEEIYKELRVSYLLDKRLDTFYDYLNTSLCTALKTTASPKNAYTDMVYFKHSKQLLANG